MRHQHVMLHAVSPPLFPLLLDACLRGLRFIMVVLRFRAALCCWQAAARPILAHVTQWSALLFFATLFCTVPVGCNLSKAPSLVRCAGFTLLVLHAERGVQLSSSHTPRNCRLEKLWCEVSMCMAPPMLLAHCPHDCWLHACQRSTSLVCCLFLLVAREGVRYVLAP